jgi:adenylate kinase
LIKSLEKVINVIAKKRKKGEKIMNIIMLGAQGTGKGTVAGLISGEIGIPQISTGDIFRKNISEKTPLGIEADKYISKGNLVPDEITVPMVKDRLTWEDAKNGVILDGFPRTIEQAEKLDEILAECGEKIDLVINLTTPYEEIIDRMITRRVCTNSDCKATFNVKLNPPKKEGICDKCGAPLKQRADDSDPEAIKRRLEIYEEITSPLVQYYENKGVLRTEMVSLSVNRMGQDVANDIVKEIKGM